jgi:hypothetical protein
MHALEATRQPGSCRPGNGRAGLAQLQQRQGAAARVAGRCRPVEERLTAGEQHYQAVGQAARVDPVSGNVVGQMLRSCSPQSTGAALSRFIALTPAGKLTDRQPPALLRVIAGGSSVLVAVLVVSL